VEKNSEQTSGKVVKQLLGPASFQSCGLRVSRCAGVFGLYEHDSDPLYSLLTGPRHLWFFSCSRRWNWYSRGDVLTAL